jgi:hypothetical protein
MLKSIKQPAEGFLFFIFSRFKQQQQKQHVLSVKHLKDAYRQYIKSYAKL